MRETGVFSQSSRSYIWYSPFGMQSMMTPPSRTSFSERGMHRRPDIVSRLVADTDAFICTFAARCGFDMTSTQPWLTDAAPASTKTS